MKTEQKLRRHEAILSSLKKLEFMSRSQIQRLHSLGSDRNARRILADLSEFVSTFRGETGEYVYYLNKAGRDRVGGDKIVTKAHYQVGHYLMRGDTYIHYKGNEDWKNELRVSVPEVVTLIPDAYFRWNLKRHFLEVDHLQHMNKNLEKIVKYKKIKETGVFQKQLQYFPRLVWVTLTETRRKQLQEWCDGLDTVVHLWDEIK